MNFVQIKRQMTVKAALLLFITVVLVTVVRPFFIELDLTFTYIGVAASLFTGANYLFLNYSSPKSWHPYLLYLVVLAILTPLLIMSGGVGSPFVVVVPLLPIFFVIMASIRAAWVLTSLMILSIVLMVFFDANMPNLVEGQGVEFNAESRAMWLILACLIGVKLSADFTQLYHHSNSQSIEPSSLDPISLTHSKSGVFKQLANKIVEAKVKQHWLSVLVIDLDIDELKGTTTYLRISDQAIKSVARCLKQSIRNKNDAIGRYSSNQFLVILEGADQSSAKRVAEKIRQQVYELELSSAEKPEKYVATLGYCSLPGDQIHSTAQFLSSAEDALSAAKNNGKNCVVGSEQAVINEPRALE